MNEISLKDRIIKSLSNTDVFSVFICLMNVEGLEKPILYEERGNEGLRGLSTEHLPDTGEFEDLKQDLSSFQKEMFNINKDLDIIISFRQAQIKFEKDNLTWLV